MTLNGWIQILVYCGILLLLVKPLGGYMHRVFKGDRTLLSPVLVPIERGLYRLAGTSEKEEQHWAAYATGMLLFNLAGFLVLYALQRLQGALPYNPAGMAAVEPELAFNTAASFVTNTNWQNYGGESTMSYL
ncbi:MAG: potassium-transporting ATPase subunit KdpA, partial [Mesorhizobium sp.]